jgi:biopolymer transport protein ExbD
MKNREPQSVDVTAFLSLMVILVPFLLVTAVFSRTAVLDVQAAAAESRATTAESPELRIVIRADTFDVGHVGQQGQQSVSRTAGAPALDTLAQKIVSLQREYPDTSQAIVLVEPQISYATLVQVLDILRDAAPVEEGSAGAGSRLLQVALGPAPALSVPGGGSP